MDQLLCHGRHEESHAIDRRAFANDDASDYLEAVESAIQAEMGTVEAWHTRMACKQDVILG